jgi:MoxR-like ATPase
VLFIGKPGTGKTGLAMRLLREADHIAASLREGGLQPGQRLKAGRVSAGLAE